MNDAIFLPVVNSRNSCTTPVNPPDETQCPKSEFPVVTVQARVPLHGQSVALVVSPIHGFQAGSWVLVGTGDGAAPFVGRVIAKSATQITVANAMSDGRPIVLNPAPSAVIPQCASIVIVTEPANVSADPGARCTPDMAVPSETEIVSLAGLTRAGTVELSAKCQKFIHRVGSDGKTLWAPDMEPVTTANTAARIAVFDSNTGKLKWLDYQAVAPAMLTITTGGAIRPVTTLPAEFVTSATAPEIALGTRRVVALLSGELRNVPVGLEPPAVPLPALTLLTTPVDIQNSATDHQVFNSGHSSGNPAGVVGTTTVYNTMLAQVPTGARTAYLHICAGVDIAIGSGVASVTVNGLSVAHASLANASNSGNLVRTESDFFHAPITNNTINYLVNQTANGTAFLYTQIRIVGYIL